MQTTEKRLFGQMTLIKKDDRLLLIVDNPKPEMSAGVDPAEWWNSTKPVLNVPAGGRQTNRFQLEETFRQTATRELTEEMLDGLPAKAQLFNRKIVLPPRDRYGFKTKRQISPFVTAQRSPNNINQIAVTSALVDINDFSRQASHLIEVRIGNQLAHWVHIKDIYDALMTGNAQTAEFHGMTLRPQMFTAALIWWLDYWQNTELHTLKESITSWNKKVIESIKMESRRLNLPIRNGAFSDDGNVAQLSRRDRQFILE